MNQPPAISLSTRTAITHAGLDADRVVALISSAIDEDVDGGIDVTSVATIDPDQRSAATLGARQSGVVAGLPIATAVFEVVSGLAGSTFQVHVADGNRVTSGQILATISAPTRSLLLAERTSLNLLCHLSGVATLTRKWADAIAGTQARVRDTRKTTPGLRALEKYAVRCGGGVNHRMGLFDMALVKDNHILAAGGVAAAFSRVRNLDPKIPVQIEVDSIAALAEAIQSGAHEVLIDNFNFDQMRRAVEYRNTHAPAVRLEASGGLTIADAREVAATGVDWIAVGELTHSAPALDIGLDITPGS
jgi:nicotinate-nucleotide pyrophosphorylase (carboxylating)